MTQEFGTVSTVRVIFALLRENEAFHFSSGRERDFYARALASAFSPESQIFREAVVVRGCRLVEMALHHLGNK